MGSMLTGLMQEAPLTMDRLIRRMRDVTGGSMVIGVSAGGVLQGVTFAEIAERALRLGGLLSSLGVTPGDRVASLAFNTIDHLTLFLGVPAHGVVLQTVNPRFTSEQIEYVLEHGGARALFVQQPLLDLVRPALARLQSLEHIIVTDASEDCDGDRMVLADALGE